MDSKLSKITTMKQLDANFLMIERNQFFDNRNNKVSQLKFPDLDFRRESGTEKESSALC